MILWVSARSSSLAARLGLALSGLPAEVRDVSLRGGDTRTPGFLALNPKGQVPVLQLDDGAALTETPAILLALGEMAPDSGLIPRDAMARWRVMEWLSWVAFTLPGAFRPGFQPGHFGPPAAEGAIREAALKRAEAALAFAAGRLDGDWAVGDAPTAADCSLALLTVLGGFLGTDVPEALLDHRRRLFALPALLPTIRAEGFHA